MDKNKCQKHRHQSRRPNSLTLKLCCRNGRAKKKRIINLLNKHIIYVNYTFDSIYLVAKSAAKATHSIFNLFFFFFLFRTSDNLLNRFFVSLALCSITSIVFVIISVINNTKNSSIFLIGQMCIFVTNL